MTPPFGPLWTSKLGVDRSKSVDVGVLLKPLEGPKPLKPRSHGEYEILLNVRVLLR